MITNLLGNNPVWLLIQQSDMVTFGILIILLLLSVLCWALFACKLWGAFIKKRQLKKARMLMNSAKSIDDIRAVAARLSGTMPGYFIAKNLLYYKSTLEQHDQGSYERKKHFVELMRHELNNAIDTILEMQESYAPFFSTTAAVAPLLGLLGTVWGLIHSFLRISQFQSADIATVAPGMAEALIVTLAGLLVAIPALVMYNYQMAQVKSFEKRLQPIADKMDVIITQAITR